jgi:putative ABC transport system permease protein
MNSPFGLALRSLQLRKRYSMLATCTVALGIAAALVAGAVAKAVLLRELPFPRGERLVWIGESGQREPETGTSLPALRRWREASSTLELVSGFTSRSVRLTGRGSADQVPVTYVSHQFFQLLGVGPKLGRGFEPDDDQAAAPPVAVVSSSFWRARLGGARDVVGQTVVLDGVAHEIVGVMPPEFTFPGEQTAAWVPLLQKFWQFDGADGVNLVLAIGRLRPGHAARESQAELRQIEARLAPEQSQERILRPFVRGLRDQLTREVRPRVYVLLTTALLMLLLGYVNLANMFTAEVLRRRHTVAICHALGAPRGVVLRQLVWEIVVLVGAGVTTGVGTAYAILAGSAAYSLDGLPELTLARLGVQELGIGLALGAAMIGSLSLLGVLALRGVVASELLSGASKQSAGRREARRRNVLVVVELAVTMILLTSAGVLAKSFLALARTRFGFEPAGVFVARLSRPVTILTPEVRGRVRSDLASYLDRLQATPGLEVSALSTQSPEDPNRMISIVRSSADGQALRVGVVAVTSRYFDVLRIPLRDGRAFYTSDDDRAGVLAAVIDESMARQAFGSQPPVGRTIALPDLDLRVEVVGVVGQVHQGGATTVPLPQLYLPYGSLPLPWVTILARSRLSADVVQQGLRRAAAAMDPDQPVVQFAKLADRMASQLDRSRFYAMVLASFAVVSLVMTGLGLYGVVSLLVLQRRREFGIRMSLGASPRDIVWHVLSHVLGLTLVGLVCGIGATVLSGRVLTALLYGVAPVDPGIVILCIAGILGVAALACWSPARSIVQLNPALLTRNET